MSVAVSVHILHIPIRPHPFPSAPLTLSFTHGVFPFCLVEQYRLTNGYYKQNPKEPNADSICMLLANLSKHPSITRLVTLTRTIVPALSPSKLAVTQLLELFNKGAGGGYNKEANFDYLAWFFGDLAKVLFFLSFFYATPPTPSLLTSNLQEIESDYK